VAVHRPDRVIGLPVSVRDTPSCVQRWKRRVL